MKVEQHVVTEAEAGHSFDFAAFLKNREVCVESDFPQDDHKPQV